MSKSAIKIEIDEKELFKQTLAQDMKATIEEITDHIDNLTLTRTNLIKKAWPDFDWMVHRVTMFWECPTSPIGYCIYNGYEDRAFDNCLFCHEPHERK